MGGYYTRNIKRTRSPPRSPSTSESEGSEHESSSSSSSSSSANEQSARGNLDSRPSSSRVLRPRPEPKVAHKVPAAIKNKKFKNCASPGPVATQASTSRANMDSVVVKKDEEEDDNEEEKEEKEEVVVVDANQGSDAVAADLSPDSAAMQAAEELVRKERTEEYVRRHLGAQFSSVTVIDHPELVTPEDWRLKLVAYAQRPVTPRHRESRTWTSRLTDESVYPVFRNQTTGEYKCVRCDKKFAKRRMLYRHYGSHDGLLPCPQCGQIFANEDSRQEHYRTAQHEQQPCRKCNLPLDVAAQAAHYIRAHLAFARP